MNGQANVLSGFAGQEQRRPVQGDLSGVNVQEVTKLAH
jgi:hypothetical protein